MMKQVANKDAILRINKEGTWIEEGDLSFEVSESDGYALEEALRVREKLSGEVVVCSMGPARVNDYIPNEPREVEAEYALSNSFGFGGTNAALLFKRYDG